MTVIGIDLGTTNSLVGVWRDDAVKLIPNAHGEVLTPSVISVDEHENVIVGKAAKERLIKYPDNTVAAFKRRMGTQASCTLGKQKFRPEELSALILKQLKDDAESFLGEPISEAVISVPAYFNDMQRNATKRAAELIGLKVERLINEPTAAAIAYGLHDRADDCHYLILDLGGGTFDVSVLEFFEGVMEVHASAGDNFLGGEDFTDLLCKACLESCGINEKKLSSRDGALIKKAIELAKKELGSKSEVLVTANLTKSKLEWKLTKSNFESIVEPLLQKIKHPIERALRDAKLKPSDFDEVVLVGGATRMPVIRSLVSKIIRRIPVSTINPDEVVCHGAVIQAALLEKHEALKDVVLTDVSPYTMGIKIASSKGNGNYESGHFMPIIERNSVVPISRVDRVNTVQNGQSELSVEIFQGENRLVKNNIFLGRLSVNVPKNKAGEECVDIRFTYDTNGILEVMTKVVSTGHEQSLLIENSDVNMSKDQIEESFKKLSSIKLHPREEAQNIALFARAERLYEETLGDSRNYVGHIIGQFEQALDTQDHEVAKQAREDLDKVLDEIEGAGVLS